MRTVWKFKLNPKTSLDLPMDWAVADVGTQGDDAFIWIVLNPTLPTHRERFVAVPTGGDVPDDADHVGTFHMNDNSTLGRLVFHVFVLSGAA